MVLDNKYDDDLVSAAAKARRSLKVDADFEAGFKNAGTTPKEGVAVSEGQENKNVSDTQDFGFVEEGSKSDEAHDLSRVCRNSMLLCTLPVLQKKLLMQRGKESA